MVIVSDPYSSGKFYVRLVVLRDRVSRFEVKFLEIVFFHTRPRQEKLGDYSYRTAGVQSELSLRPVGESKMPTCLLSSESLHLPPRLHLLGQQAVVDELIEGCRNTCFTAKTHH